MLTKHQREHCRRVGLGAVLVVAIPFGALLWALALWFLWSIK
jgi:hypothetical protein